jgi:adenylyltransferase/sulfurtransferase
MLDINQLTQDEYVRYGAHLLMPEINIEGQKKLKKSKVLIVGAGGLGSPLSLYLAAAGIGTIGIADFDAVDISNLQRQILFKTADRGKLKTQAAKERIEALNPFVRAIEHSEILNSSNALEILGGYDIVADAADNFQTRYLINDACALLGIPDVYGSIFQFEGQASVFYARHGACYRCLMPVPPPPNLVPSCSEGGVIGTLAGIIGSLQAQEIIKLITGAGETLIGRLIVFDAKTSKMREIKINKDENCPVCGSNPSIKKLIDYDEFCGLKRDGLKPIKDISAEELKKKMDSGQKTQIIDIRADNERLVFNFPKSRCVSFEKLTGLKDDLDPSIETIFVCAKGLKSVFAIRILEDDGFKGEMFNLEGGAKRWFEIYGSY